ncbi:cupin domain-containing protein [Salinarimonas soli]|uniref:Cupin domain-containing protein n=1 Tax=Salinarimonas soli TaxID=1638099 RepID=A0A5B2VDU3_9HYPH|nr:cupin domain-containing protein [Salinarimonas soli]KAA2236592.1 cupin domain-containing protein [Salinarimonas soli]
MSDTLSRRGLLAAGAAGGLVLTQAAQAATFGNPDLPPQGAINANPGSVTDPGPSNPDLARNLPSFTDPPATDVGSMGRFWNSFNTAPRRQQNGGWARQVTKHDFSVSDQISGVNMRLSRGGIRELHWHQQAEWAVVTNGAVRVTVMDEDGRASVADVKAGGLWYFPAGFPHGLQGIGPDGAEFVLAFDNGEQTEYNTLLVTDWVAHTPPEVLAKNFGMPAETFRNIPLQNRWIFQGEPPGSLAADQASVRGPLGDPPRPFIFDLAGKRPDKVTAGGQVQIADSRNFEVSTTIAAAMVTLKPGAIREMHWHPNADEWQYWIAGEGRMTVFDTGPAAQTADFRAGDIGVVKKNLGHYIENTGSTDAVFMEIFRTNRYAEFSLTQWLAMTPPAIVAATLNLDPAVVERLPKDRAEVMPR